MTLPPGYLQAVYPLVRQAGALCVADEVQTGFGRSGSHFWAFETQDVVPDIVTLGKPIANGFPLAAVVTHKEVRRWWVFDAKSRHLTHMLTTLIPQQIAESLPHSYFNSYGGNNLAMAMGEAVLDVVLQEDLQASEPNAWRSWCLWVFRSFTPPPTPPYEQTNQGKALALGTHLRRRFEELMGKHALVGSVRGLGMMLGVELVTDRCVR